MKRHSPETEAAIMAALLAGQGVCETAAAFDVSQATVSRIKARLSDHTLNEIECQKKQEIADLLAGYLRETIVTLAAQQRLFRNEPWLKKQSAHDLAVLHGVSADKGFRLLEAIERAHSVDAGAGRDLDAADGAAD